MFIWLFDWSEKLSAYDCSGYNVTDVPPEERQHKYVGYALIILAVLFEIVYVPVVIVIYRLSHLSSCYKIMFYIAVCDVLSIPVIGIADGVMALRGDVFCSIPKTNHVLGLLASVFWYAESSAAVLLAANRCIDVAWSKVDKFLTTGNRTWVLLLAPTVYALAVITFTRPVFFNAIYACWFYHPHVGYLNIPPENYDNRVHDFHNWFIAIALITLYIVFASLLMYKQRQKDTNKNTNNAENRRMRRSQKIMFAQVFVVIAINALAATIYDIIQFVQLSKFITVGATFLWLGLNGVPGVAYFAMNPTIRQECLVLLGLRKQGNQVHSGGGSLTVSASARGTNRF